MSTRMVVLVVDALGWNLASRAPGFARGLTQRRRIETVLGFSSGSSNNDLIESSALPS